VTTIIAPASAPARVARGRHGAVASPHHLATQTGLATLRSGGTAVDAAIATNAALAVVSGHSCGLGGDAFWIIWDADRSEAVTLNGSGRSGSDATITGARAAGYADMPERGPWSITVPGGVHSWGLAHERFGRLDWSSLLAPAIDLADGFPASTGWLGAIEGSTEVFGDGGDWARTYRPDMRAHRPGQTVRLPALSQTLRTLSDEGADAAYRGTIAASTAAYFARRRVPISADDLAAHTSDWGTPISIAYRGITALSHAPNSVGVIALQTLGLLQRFGPPAPADFDGRGWADPEWIHVGLEASRLGLAQRDARITDPVHMPIESVAEMLSDELLDTLAAGIDPDRAMTLRPGSLPAGGGTIYLTTADPGASQRVGAAQTDDSHPGPRHAAARWPSLDRAWLHGWRDPATGLRPVRLCRRRWRLGCGDGSSCASMGSDDAGAARVAGSHPARVACASGDRQGPDSQGPRRVDPGTVGLDHGSRPRHRSVPRQVRGDRVVCGRIRPAFRGPRSRVVSNPIGILGRGLSRCARGPTSEALSQTQER